MCLCVTLFPTRVSCQWWPRTVAILLASQAVPVVAPGALVLWNQCQVLVLLMSRDIFLGITGTPNRVGTSIQPVGWRGTQARARAHMVNLFGRVWATYNFYLWPGRFASGSNPPVSIYRSSSRPVRRFTTALIVTSLGCFPARNNVPDLRARCNNSCSSLIPPISFVSTHPPSRCFPGFLRVCFWR
jgi:hypothetical protein